MDGFIPLRTISHINTDANYPTAFFHSDYVALTLDERRRNALREVDTARFSWFHVKVALVASIGFFTDAYDIFAVSLPPHSSSLEKLIVINGNVADQYNRCDAWIRLRAVRQRQSWYQSRYSSWHSPWSACVRSTGRCPWSEANV